MSVRTMLALCAVVLSTASTFAGEPTKIDFAHDVAPLLKARCAECHTNGKYKGGLSFDTREDAIKSGLGKKDKAAELLKRIASADPEERMPPKGEPLTAKEVERLRAWIDQGLPWEPGFSFKATSYVPPLKPRRPEIPPAKVGLEHPIDRLLDVYAAKNKVELSGPVDDAVFVRRAYLDVLGMLPTPAEAEAFAKDTSPTKRERLVRRLLNERRPYAEHWLSFWNDMLRNEYSGTGYIDGGRKQSTPWLYRSLVENKPYDQFARELVSPGADSDAFAFGIRWRGAVNASQVVELQFSQNVSQVFFGINMKCASCHDSFIDHWKLDDAYSLAAVISDRPLEIHRCDKKTGKFAQPRFVFPELGTIDAKASKAERLKQLAKLVTHEGNGRFTRTIANRLWQRLMGRGIVHPVDVMGNRPWSEDLLDYLGAYLQDNDYDLQKLLEHVMTSRAYQSRPVRQEKEPVGDRYVYRGPEVRRMSAEQFLDAIWQVTKTGPATANAPAKVPPFTDATPAERRFVRASMVHSNSLMRSLGRPLREQVVTTRPDQLTTLQALDLSNGAVFADMMSRGAANLLKTDAKASAEQLVETIYRQALCRAPSADEMASAREFVGSPPTADGVADLLWAVSMLPEFQLVR